MEFAMIIDVILLLLLCVTLFFGIRLSRQFAEIREDQDKLATLVEDLNRASLKAEKAVGNMKNTAVVTSETLQGQISKGQALFDELEIMVEAGDSLAERLQKIAEKSRKAVEGSSKETTSNNKAQSKKAKSTAKDEVDQKARTRAEKELLEALKAHNE
jgi:hypothetical protein